MLDIIQYEFNISFTINERFLRKRKCMTLNRRHGPIMSSGSKPALGLVDRWQQMMQGMPWVSQYFTKHPLIRWIADLSKCRVSLWQETPLHCLFQHTLQSTSTLRIKQAPPCLRCVCESGYEGGSSHLPQQRSGQTMPPQRTNGIHSLCTPGHQTVHLHSKWECALEYVMVCTIHLIYYEILHLIFTAFHLWRLVNTILDKQSCFYYNP